MKDKIIRLKGDEVHEESGMMPSNIWDMDELDVATYGMSNEQKLAMFDKQKQLMLGVGKPIKGKVIIFGTGGNMRRNNDFKLMWESGLA